MLRFKYFAGSGADLEGAINDWLREFEPEVTYMTQASHGENIVITFLFDESFRGQERRLTAERGTAYPTMPPVPSDSIPDTPLKVPIEPGDITSDVH